MYTKEGRVRHVRNFLQSKNRKYFTFLRIRNSILKNQLMNGGALTADVNYDELMLSHKSGEIKAFELIIQELEQEFDLYNPDSDLNKSK